MLALSLYTIAFSFSVHTTSIHLHTITIVPKKNFVPKFFFSSFDYTTQQIIILTYSELFIITSCYHLTNNNNW